MGRRAATKAHSDDSPPSLSAGKSPSKSSKSSAPKSRKKVQQETHSGENDEDRVRRLDIKHRSYLKNQDSNQAKARERYHARKAAIRLRKNPSRSNKLLSEVSVPASPTPSPAPERSSMLPVSQRGNDKPAASRTIPPLLPEIAVQQDSMVSHFSARPNLSVPPASRTATVDEDSVYVRPSTTSMTSAGPEEERWNSGSTAEITTSPTTEETYAVPTRRSYVLRPSTPAPAYENTSDTSSTPHFSEVLGERRSKRALEDMMKDEQDRYLSISARSIRSKSDHNSSPTTPARPAQLVLSFDGPEAINGHWMTADGMVVGAAVTTTIVGNDVHVFVDGHRNTVTHDMSAHSEHSTTQVFSLTNGASEVKIEPKEEPITDSP